MEFGPILKSLKHRKAFTFLIVLQVALTLTAMTLSVIYTQETLKEWGLPSGLDQTNIVAVMPQIFDDKLDLKQVVENDLKLLSKIPGVSLASTAVNIPFGALNVQDIFKETGEKAQSYQTNFFDFNQFGLKILGVKLIAGRDFKDTEIIQHDPANSQLRPSVVMISDQMAEAMFATNNAVGQTLYLEKDGFPVEVIGVYSGFMNGEQLNGQGMSYRSVIRPLVEYQTGQDPNYLLRVEPRETPEQDEILLESIRSAMYQTQGRFVQGVEYLKRTQKRMYDGRGTQALLMLVISSILLLITALGISGLISFLVAQQKKQIGTRRALGAKKWQILRYYLLENTLVTGMGLVIGSISAVLLIIKLAEDTPLQVTSFSVMGIIALFIWLVSLLSALRPSRRASQVSPAIVTRGG